ncbi:MAG: LysR family transcriptional regulator [Betaproteobacteria bacterium]|jgi:DNA-binding transcriptional LysR family regulator|nr:LysR family transcriptional regulator [Betaproteobacteria bacterium]
MNLDIPGLQAFARIAELGSFHQAAEALHLSQSALSRRISKLEQGLGVRLLDRTTRKVRLTAVGRDFLPQARRLIEELAQSLDGLRDMAKRGAGQVSVACVPTAAFTVLPPVIRDYSAKHPDNRIRILDLHANEVLQAVQGGDAEFGLTLSGADAPEIEAEALFEDPFVLACHPDHLLARRKTVKWAELEQHRVITVGRLSGNRALLDFGLPGNLPRQRWTYEVQHSFSTGLALALAGIGVIAVPELALAGQRDARLVSRPLVEPRLTRTLAVIRRRGVTLSPAAQEFLTMLKKRWTGPRREGRGKG